MPFRSTAAELREARAAYNLLVDDLENHPKEMKQGRFTIDDAVAVLPCAADADTLVFIRGNGEIVDEIMHLGRDGVAAFHVSFIDARTGRVFDHVAEYREVTTMDTEDKLGWDLEHRIKGVKKHR